MNWGFSFFLKTVITMQLVEELRAVFFNANKTKKNTLNSSVIQRKKITLSHQK